MSRLWFAVGLLVLAVLMAVGMMRANLGAAEGVAVLIAVLVVIVLPGVFAFKLFYDMLLGDKRVAANKADLRTRTLEAEALKLAESLGGKLTILEVVKEFAISPEDAKETLDGLARRGLADFQVTDAGVVVYDFVELRRIADKENAKGILDD
ncbi:MAG TPA: hypothetical protein VM100_08975 [Longimicrobiales bacterium]|nr:hypothetical protein [Longimicrobiales bacterium]